MSCCGPFTHPHSAFRKGKFQSWSCHPGRLESLYSNRSHGESKEATWNEGGGWAREKVDGWTLSIEEPMKQTERQRSIGMF